MTKRIYHSLFLLLCAALALPLSGQDVANLYFQGDTLVEISQSGRAATATTFTYDAGCEQLGIVVTDPDNAPLPGSNAYVVRLRNDNGTRVTDLTDRLTVTMRARSAEEVPVQFLFRSGEGSSDFRTAGKEVIIPASLDGWTEMSVTFTAADFGPSFDPADIRDLWFYLDRGNDNFPGNQFWIDHIVVGGPVDASQNSPCMLGGGGGMETDTMFAAAYFQGDTLVEISQSGRAAAATTFTYDSGCEQLGIVVTDPDNAPLPGGNAYVFRLRDADGNRVTNLTDRLTVTLRARSAEEVPVDFLFRSGDGTSDFRTGRQQVIIPAGLDQWTEVTATFSMADFGPSFDPTDIRDLWLYLDRGTANFPGNQFWIDHVVVGGAPDETQNSPCMLGGGGGGTTDADFYVDYFQADSLTSFNTTNAAARRSNIVLNTECETVSISIIDSIGDPLPRFNAFQINPRDDAGRNVTDITDNMTVTMRVRSRDSVNVSVLLRSGGGSQDERSDRLDFDVPAGLEDWTEVTLTFTAAEMGGFVADDLRDVWFYLDRGTENFNGNLFEIDHIAVGRLPDAAQNSPCPLDPGGDGVIGSYVTYFQAPDSASLANINLNNAAARRLNFAVDNDCETIALSVIDPVNDPLPRFNAVQVNPVNAAGEDITDLGGNLTVSMRVRSAEAINISVLLRSGGGSMEERTDRLDVDIPGDLENYTDFTLTFTQDDLAGFNPSDLRDMWFYLDRGEENFAGNLLIIDHIAVGQAPDPAFNSDCALTVVPQSYAVQFDNAESTAVLGGAEAQRLTLTTNDCEEVQIAVTDPTGAPFGAFRPLIINPTNADGASITDITGLTTVYIRARSAATVPVSILFRSGDGSSAFRTAAVTRTVVGDLEQYSNLEFTFTEAELAGFDPADLVDMWLYLDRENDNFPGNELYIDYIAIGERPDAADASPCARPDIAVGTNEVAWASDLSVFPNPTTGLLTVDVPQLAGSGERMTARVLDLTGREVAGSSALLANGRADVDLTGLPAGIYFLHLRDRAQNGVVRRIVKR